ncbi:NAD(P)-dependent alcohol dehydrogenase [Bifidobacterium sp. ESL0732]|uniref:NAD(P)-dependent alcohol dehydrogenase n=1 Tax=Bifidobacterium sp. ESL0732 TaxID=2983222 RepID=UPI0023F93385|nr:NAD(P)-dependent alcohol dehydrogenase [Bifidobacterium sp. ESL0732]WEV63919.1 NAD(P)-dependent alcohol dehydrogenase [Bifidobacterium sp. ESL0732]
MKAVVFKKIKTFPSLEEVEKPTPGPGEVLLKVAGAGCCHSDVSVFQEYDEALAKHEHTEPSFILGHETSGWVEEVGQGVTGFKKGDAYLIYGPTGCGHCARCVAGEENYCENTATNESLAMGLGRDGGMAEYVVAPARNLVPLGDADPINAAPLADAALTPYHAIKAALPHLQGGGKYALVIGLGGLGQIAIQILSAITGATIIATDMKPEAIAKAEEKGAIGVKSDEHEVENILKITGGRGVDAAFDFVGIAPTIAAAQAAAAIGSRVTIVGIAGGKASYDWFTNSWEQELTSVYWGSLPELHEVAALYEKGLITPEIETYSMDNALDAYHKLVDGKLSKRAVVVPHMGE